MYSFIELQGEDIRVFRRGRNHPSMVANAEAGRFTL